jgi:hypothetical protein
MFSILALPEDFASTTLGYVGIIFSDLSGLILLIIGVLLALVAIEILIGIFRAK